MPLSVLARLFSTERRHQRVARQASGTIAGANVTLPILSEVEFNENAAPLLATNMRGSFVVTGHGKTGIVRYGYSEVPLEDEAALLVDLYQSVRRLAIDNSWTNLCRTPAEGIARLRSFGLDPKFVVLSKQDLPPGGETVAVEQLHESVAETEDVTVLFADLPRGAALVTTLPILVGLYTRVGNHLGILVQKVDRTVVVVDHGMD